MTSSSGCRQRPDAHQITKHRRQRQVVFSERGGHVAKLGHDLPNSLFKCLIKLSCSEKVDDDKISEEVDANNR
jgi:hypothetical protein